MRIIFLSIVSLFVAMLPVKADPITKTIQRTLFTVAGIPIGGAVGLAKGVVTGAGGGALGSLKPSLASPAKIAISPFAVIAGAMVGGATGFAHGAIDGAKKGWGTGKKKQQTIVLRMQ